MIEEQKTHVDFNRNDDGATVYTSDSTTIQESGNRSQDTQDGRNGSK